MVDVIERPRGRCGDPSERAAHRGRLHGAGRHVGEQQVDAIIVDGIGGRPLMGFNQVGIAVHAGVGGDVRTAVQAFIEGGLPVVGWKAPASTEGAQPAGRARPQNSIPAARRSAHRTRRREQTARSSGLRRCRPWSRQPVPMVTAASAGSASPVATRSAFRAAAGTMQSVQRAASCPQASTRLDAFGLISSYASTVSSAARRALKRSTLSQVVSTVK